jgi:hypothetical protein
MLSVIILNVNMLTVIKLCIVVLIAIMLRII